MIEMRTAFTEEIDDVELAVEEILSQLDLAELGQANCLGLLTCYSDFVESGVAQAISERLPFDVIGCTTIANGVNGNASMMMLSLSVLVSKDVCFHTAQTGSLLETQDSIREAYQAALAEAGQQPEMIFALLPLIPHLGGELLLNVLDEVSGGVPVFGTLACDHNVDYHTSVTMFNGVTAPDCIVMALFTGNVQPKYIISSISEEKMQQQRSVITASEGSLLKQINNMPSLDYMKTLGLVQGGGIEGMNAIPFLVDYNDGTPAVARAMYLVQPDTGDIVCGGNMPVGATLAIGNLDAEDVLKTAKKGSQMLCENGPISCAFFFPCLSRILVLGARSDGEAQAVAEQLGDIPHHFSYSGGELCPVFNAAGQASNRFHNFTIIGCAF